MKKILVVDDSPTIRVNAKYLIKNLGYEVAEAANGSEALKIIDSDAISLILLDIHMPVLNGLEMLKKMEGIEKYEEIPIFIISTDDAEERVSAAEKYGVKGWLHKPFKNKDVKTIVELYLED